MTGRPMVNVYEPDHEGVEQLVYRRMNDDEYTVWQSDVAVAHAKEQEVNPLVAQVEAMSSSDKAALRTALGVS